MYGNLRGVLEDYASNFKNQKEDPFLSFRLESGYADASRGVPRRFAEGITLWLSALACSRHGPEAIFCT